MRAFAPVAEHTFNEFLEAHRKGKTPALAELTTDEFYDKVKVSG